MSNALLPYFEGGVHSNYVDAAEAPPCCVFQILTSTLDQARVPRLLEIAVSVIGTCISQAPHSPLGRHLMSQRVRKNAHI